MSFPSASSITSDVTTLLAEEISLRHKLTLLRVCAAVKQIGTQTRPAHGETSLSLRQTSTYGSYVATAMFIWCR